MPKALLPLSNPFDLQVNVGDCSKCELRQVCRHRNDTDITCRAVRLATEYFNSFVQTNPSISAVGQDDLFIRSTAALYSLVILAEMRLRKYGAFKQRAFYKQYLGLLKQFQEALTGLGLSPQGRRQLRDSVKKVTAGKSVLEAYLETKVIDTPEVRALTMPERNKLAPTFMVKKNAKLKREDKDS